MHLESLCLGRSMKFKSGERVVWYRPTAKPLVYQHIKAEVGCRAKGKVSIAIVKKDGTKETRYVYEKQLRRPVLW